MDTKQSRYEALFRDSSVWRSIFSLALPSLLTIVVMIFYNMADLFFIAQLRDTAKVAAVSIVMPVFSIIMALATMLGAGGSAILANAIGAGDREKAKNTSSLCFWAAIGIGLFVSVLLLSFQTPLLRLLGTKPEMWEDAKRYQSVLALGTSFMLLSSSMGMLIRSEGAVKEGLIGNLAGTFTNILLDPLFILIFRWGTTGAAIATVYIVLGILYESYVHPLTILSTLPSAGVGALLALELFNAPFSLIALIGIMLLIGIVKKNAIMMVDFALEAQRHGNLTPQEAIFQACLLRFRPIMMTTLAALFGALPLVLSGGDGSELRQPLGITIVGGLVMSQLLTLYTTPVVYLFFDRLRLRFSRKSKQTVTE